MSNPFPHLPDRVGRLLCVGVRGATPGDPELEADLDACAAVGVGGVLLFDVDVPARDRAVAAGSDPETARHAAPRNILDPDQLARLIAHLRERLGRDLWVAIDQEGGQVARLSPARGFGADPSATQFARLDPASRVEAADRQARRLARLGIDLNFAPCVDLALEASNQIIVGLDRAYAADPKAVQDAAAVVLEAHRRAGVASCLKHFPGHGSSRGDTHAGAVDVTSTWRQAELEPYRALASRPGVAVMVAHVRHRDVDPDLPMSLSAAGIDGLLRREVGFGGVVVTDSLDMRAIAGRFSSGDAAVAALGAGADLVVDGFNLTERPSHPARELTAAIRAAVDDGRLSPERIEASLARLDRLRSEIGAPT